MGMLIHRYPVPWNITIMTPEIQHRPLKFPKSKLVRFLNLIGRPSPLIEAAHEKRPFLDR